MLEGNTLRAKLVENTPAQGTLGFKGERGYSNYEIYVKNGGTLTEQEWLDHFGVDLTDVVKVQDIVNNVTTNTSTKPLSAAQGRYLKNYIDTYTENEIGDTPSLDTTSKIVVGAINEVNAKIKSNTDIVDLIYPVGSIYLSVNSTNPGTLFGGTWEQLKDRFLLGSGDSYTGGTTGGNASLNLNHSHGSGTLIASLNFEGGGIRYYYDNSVRPAYNYTETFTASEETGTGTMYGGTRVIGSTGSSLNNNQSILPPYLTVYMWKRTE